MTEEQEHQLLLPLVEEENICLPLPLTLYLDIGILNYLWLKPLNPLRNILILMEV